MNTLQYLFSPSPPASSPLLLPALELPGLWLPTGQLAACDPLVSFGPRPFTRAFAPGRYPVYLHVLAREHCIAYAELRLSAAPVAHWEIAVTAEQDPTTLVGDEIFGYPVSAGMGCFMDASTVAVLEQHEADLEQELGDDYCSYYDDYVADELENAQYGGHEHALLQPYPDRENNVAIFQSGYGDGFYATYVGLDAAGQPVRFVTEFIDVASPDA